MGELSLSKASWRKSSGAFHRVVPPLRPGSDPREDQARMLSPSRVERPKSARQARPVDVTRILLPLMSPWTMLRLCRYWRPLAMS